ncbi:MAG: hypothetical protein RMK45_02880 [Armatimonadota bacterium]|nr:hypothetical protein [Armatimonadota bacterium]
MLGDTERKGSPTSWDALICFIALAQKVKRHIPLAYLRLVMRASRLAETNAEGLVLATVVVLHQVDLRALRTAGHEAENDLKQ